MCSGSLTVEFLFALSVLSLLITTLMFSISQILKPTENFTHYYERKLSRLIIKEMEILGSAKIESSLKGTDLKVGIPERGEMK